MSGIPPIRQIRQVLGKPKPPSERVEQAHVVQLLRSIGAHVYVLGTVRPKADSYHGTCQTPGLGDLYVILPARDGKWADKPPQPLWIEMKRRGGRVRPEQKLFAERCRAAGVAHVTGTCDDVIAYLVQGGWLKASSVAHYRQPAP